MSKTKIQWSEYSWNPISGCSPVSEGCRNCFAARMAATRLRDHPRYAGLATFSDGRARWTGEVRLNHDVLRQPLRWRKSRRVFIASMSDLFHEGVPTPFIADIWDIMAEAYQHTFQILTKRADRLPEVFHYLAKWKNYKTPLPNVWLGVSVENQAAADERIPWLLQTPAAVWFVSVEPMLEAVNLHLSSMSADGYRMLSRWYGPDGFDKTGSQPELEQRELDWVICGGESGPGARPMHPDWARSLRDQCQAAGVPFFFKQWGAWFPRSQWEHSPELVLPDDDYMTGKDIYYFKGGETMHRVGKKRAGHLLGGRAWQEFPQPQPAAE